jgi:hypothetical protein
VKSKAEILKIVKRTANRVTSMSKAEILKIVKVIACVIGFGVLGTGIGIPAMLLADEMGVLGRQQGFSGFGVLVAFLWVFGILGVALGGYVGYRITRSKDK